MVEKRAKFTSGGDDSVYPTWTTFLRCLAIHLLKAPFLASMLCVLVVTPAVQISSVSASLYPSILSVLRSLTADGTGYTGHLAEAMVLSLSTVVVYELLFFPLCVGFGWMQSKLLSQAVSLQTSPLLEGSRDSRTPSVNSTELKRKSSATASGSWCLLGGLLNITAVERTKKSLPTSQLQKVAWFGALEKQLVAQPFIFTAIFYLLGVHFSDSPSTTTNVGVLSPADDGGPSSFLISCLSVFPHFLGCRLVNDIGFYLAHRFLHTPWMYRNLHYKHHRFIGSEAISAEYAHPFEQFLGGMIPTFTYCVVMSQSITLSVWLTWFAWRMWETYEEHSGLQIQLKTGIAILDGSWIDGGFLFYSSRCRFHDWHHFGDVNSNYGNFYTDYLAGSMDSYLRRYYEDQINEENRVM